MAARGSLYEGCLTSVMLYASETWPVKQEDLSRLERIDPSVVSWMCRVKLSDCMSAKIIVERL